MEMIHENQYPQAFKICSRFVSKLWTRPLLTMINHATDGSMIATDSHRAIRIKNIHGFDKNYLIHPQTYEVATGDYPDVNKLITATEEKTLITLDKEQIAIWLQMYKSINQMKNLGFQKIVSMNILDDRISFTVKEIELNFTLPCKLSISDEQMKIKLNIEYMRDALQAFKNMESDEVTIVIKSINQPVFLTDGEKTDVVLMPVRTA